MNGERFKAVLTTLQAMTKQEFDEATQRGKDKLMLVTDAAEELLGDGMPVMPMVVMASCAMRLLGALWDQLTDVQRVELGNIAASAVYYDTRVSQFSSIIADVSEHLQTAVAETQAKVATKQ